MAWTNDQINAINARNSNLLVSAAAGSGKTAVLVERIINRVLDKENPIDIDSILVVTFTKLAAGEMRSRIANAFENCLKEEPGNRQLIRQLALVENAKISTIDSFCNDVVKNYYNTIDLDPNIRIADEAELTLIKEDVMAELIEEKFTKGDKEFLDFVEAYISGKDIRKLAETIDDLYRFSQSNPWPKEWLLDCYKPYEIQTKEEFENLPIVLYMADHFREQCKDMMEVCEYAIELCQETGGPIEYVPALRSDYDMWKAASEKVKYFDIINALKIPFKGFDRTKSTNKDTVKDIREDYKKIHKKMVGAVPDDMDKLMAELHLHLPYVKTLVELTIEFSDKYLLAKQKKNIADFSDMSHYALDILVKKENGKLVHTEVADELSEGFEEIYIDEYQDSNLVQEYLLTAVSKVRFGTPNIFMVGDVKQSIYKFRMARPEIFMEKYDSYDSYEENSDSMYKKIELHKNFRSRENVLESINDVFKITMRKAVGGIDYTEDVRLNVGGEFPANQDDKTELIIATDEDIKKIKLKKDDAPAHLAANRIKALMAENDKLRYKDFVILLRSDSEAGVIYSNILAGYGIPSSIDSMAGYFSTPEVVKVLNLLNVIDNPRQEIPLAGLMRSYFAYFSVEELATIKGKKRKTELYDCVVKYAANDNPLGKKCSALLDFIQSYREKIGVYSIHEVVSDIIYDTGYYDYVSATPGGEQKKNNLDLLVEKASKYEKTSFLGLFNFLRYIEKVKKYDVDKSESAKDDEADKVRIMSIHKSKGLEFPIVIIGNIGKEYNLNDLKSTILYDNTYGIGMDIVNLTGRIKKNSGYKNLLTEKIRIDSIGEELRILYVAMTRAVNKLILVGTEKEAKINEWEYAIKSDKFDIASIKSNITYASIVGPCAYNNTRFNIIFKKAEDIKKIMEADFVKNVKKLSKNFETISEMETDEKLFDAFKAIIEYEYPYDKILALKTKYAVSDLKHKAMEESEALEERFKLSEPRKAIPDFISKDGEINGGIVRGNAYHKVLEILDYGIEATLDGINEFLDLAVINNRLTEEYRELIDADKILKFLETPLGHNMKNAFLTNKLFREQPFIMEVGANEVAQEFPEEEKVLVQGIVDAFYITEDGVYIVDYKTDAVSKENGEEVLIERYKKQLQLYEYALNKVLQVPVKGISLYSIALNKEVHIIK